MLANVDSADCPDIGIVTGGFEFSSHSYRQIFYLSSFVALDRTSIFDYDSYYNRPPYHYPSPDPDNPIGCFGLRFHNVITLPVPFSPTENGYFSADGSYGQEGQKLPSVPVTYSYNGFRNYIPDGPEVASTAFPRIIVVTDDQNPVTYSRFLSLTAGASQLVASLVLMTSLLFVLTLVLII